MLCLLSKNALNHEKRKNENLNAVILSIDTIFLTILIEVIGFLRQVKKKLKTMSVQSF